MSTATIMKCTAYISIGSNLGDRAENIRKAVAILKEHPRIEVTKESPLYETKAIAWEDKTAQPDFLNGVLEIETTLKPEALLKNLIETEGMLGRPHPRPKGEPRTLDLDILLYNNSVLNLGNLNIPHPELEKRMFVLAPLCDIAPGARHPVLGWTVEELLTTCMEENGIEAKSQITSTK